MKRYFDIIICSVFSDYASLSHKDHLANLQLVRPVYLPTNLVTILSNCKLKVSERCLSYNILFLLITTFEPLRLVFIRCWLVTLNCNTGSQYRLLMQISRTVFTWKTLWRLFIFRLVVGVENNTKFFFVSFFFFCSQL